MRQCLILYSRSISTISTRTQQDLRSFIKGSPSTRLRPIHSLRREKMCFSGRDRSKARISKSSSSPSSPYSARMSNLLRAAPKRYYIRTKSRNSMRKVSTFRSSWSSSKLTKYLRHSNRFWRWVRTFQIFSRSMRCWTKKRSTTIKFMSSLGWKI